MGLCDTDQIATVWVEAHAYPGKAGCENELDFTAVKIPEAALVEDAAISGQTPCNEAVSFEALAAPLVREFH
jgi:hypothetical protein